jgi:hypothetical protein
MKDSAQVAEIFQISEETHHFWAFFVKKFDSSP